MRRLIICVLLWIVSCKAREFPGEYFYENPSVREALREGESKKIHTIHIYPLMKNRLNVGVYYSLENDGPHFDDENYKIFFYDTSVVKILKKEDYNKEVWQKEIELFLKQHFFKARQIKKCIKEVDYYMTRPDDHFSDNW